jgi:hypothetical protein
MKNKLTDIDEILAKSQRLTSHAGLNGSSPGGIRHVSRGVRAFAFTLSDIPVTIVEFAQ